MIARALRRFMYDERAPAVVDAFGLSPDPDLAERTRRAQEQARDALEASGRWLCAQPVARRGERMEARQ